MSILKVKNGNNWDEIPSIKGKSAYQYAVDGGYQGTEQEFAQKLADEYVKPTDYATDSAGGVVKVDNAYGLYMRSDNKLSVNTATNAQVKSGESAVRPIAPSNQHSATFYGLAKAAGDSSQSASSNAVGTYTDDAKSAIRTMLGAVGTTDWASTSDGGIVKITSGGGLTIDSSHGIKTTPATGNQVKNGTEANRPIVPSNEDAATFYGLAKAAGDSSQASSSNTVGTYTETAKSAIRAMLGVEGAAIKVDVSGTTPTITAQANVRYMCGEVLSLSITPPSVGTCDVIFTSGSSATALTLPNTVKMPDWFDATSLETNTIYEINIVDGVYGAVMTWQNS